MSLIIYNQINRLKDSNMMLKSFCKVAIILITAMVCFCSCHSPINNPDNIDTANTNNGGQEPSSISDDSAPNDNHVVPQTDTANNSEVNNNMPTAFIGMRIPQEPAVDESIKARIKPIIQKTLNTDEFYFHEIENTNWFTINLPTKANNENLRDAPPAISAYYVIDLNNNAMVAQKDWKAVSPLFDKLTEAMTDNNSEQIVKDIALVAEVISTATNSYKFGKTDIKPVFSKTETGWTLTYYTVHNNGMSAPKVCPHTLTKTGEMLNETVEKCYIP